ncbi:uncharacterized protein KZ484_010509 [Pholidichthys leucotaenia]
MKLQTTTDFPEQHVCENEFSPDQQLWNQEENLGLEQEEPEPPRVKEEQEELEPTWVKEEQEELEPIHVKEEQNELEPPQVKEEQNEQEPPQVKVEPNELELPQVKEEPNELELPQVKEEQNEQEPPQVKEELNELEPPQVKVEPNELELPQVKEELNELEPPQVKEEEEELSISQEGEQLKLKLEVDIFMVPLISEDKQQSEAEPNSEQLLSHQSAGTEIQDEQGSWHVDSGSTKEEEEPKPKKRRLKTRSHHEDPDLSHVVEEEPPSPAPTVSSLGSYASCQTRLGKWRRETSVDLLLDYLERFDERQQEQSRKNEEMSSRVLTNMEHTTATLVGMLERVVSVLEGQQNSVSQH